VNKPYYVHELFDENFEGEWNFAKLYMVGKVILPFCAADETEFHVGGFVNRHSCHYWSTFDSNVTVKKGNNLLWSVAY